MITGELFISTTWAASTSYIPFEFGMRNAFSETDFATTAYVHGVWEYQIFEEGFVDNLDDSNKYPNRTFDELRALNGGYHGITNAFNPGTVIETEVRKIKALKASPNRSGIQVSRRLLKGNKLVFRYLAIGELVRP